MKKIIIGIMLIVILSVQSVYASTLISDQKEDEYIYRKYEVTEEESIDFYNNLEESINVENVEYKKGNFVVSGGKEQDTIQVSDVKEIVTKSNSIDVILNRLPRSLEYNKDGYIGETNLNIDSIEVNDIFTMDTMKNILRIQNNTLILTKMIWTIYLKKLLKMELNFIL